MVEGDALVVLGLLVVAGIVSVLPVSPEPMPEAPEPLAVGGV